MAQEQQLVARLDALVRQLAATGSAVSSADLAELRVAAAEGELTIVLLPSGPLANGRPLTGELELPGGLLDGMRRHGVKRLFAGQEPIAEELVMMAQALAQPSTGSGGPLALRLRTVQVWNVLIPRSTPIFTSFPGAGSGGGAQGIDLDAPPQIRLVPGRSGDEPPAAKALASAAPPRESQPSSLLRELDGDLPLPEVPEVETMVGMASTHVLFDAMLTNPSPGVKPSGEKAEGTPPPLDSVFVNSPVLLRPTSSSVERKQDIEQLLGRLTTARKLAEVERLLEELLTRAEWLARNDEPVLLTRILLVVLRRSDELEDYQLRLKFQMIRGRFLIRPHLEEVAKLLPRHPEAREDILELLSGAGEAGAETVIDLLVEAESPSDRRSYFTSLTRLGAGVPTLLHMLGDIRWYAARNAAQLLGEMREVGAEGQLLDLLRHRDERVRKGALTALGKIGTLRGFQAIRGTLNDPEPAMRIHAAVTLVSCGWTYALADLKRALEREDDPEAQRMLVAAIGRLGTGEAVGVLDEMASPGSFFRRRSRTPLRLAAVHALGESGHDRATRVLARLARDRENEIRQTAARALSQRAASRATPSDLSALDDLVTEKEALSER